MNEPFEIGPAGVPGAPRLGFFGIEDLAMNPDRYRKSLVQEKETDEPYILEV